MISFEPLPRIRFAEFRGELLFQVKCIAVWIKIRASDGLLHRGDCERRRAERIFVRRDFDDGIGRQAEFARDFFNRPSWLIHWQILQIRIEWQQHLERINYFFDVDVFGNDVTDE
jgi:hypothetical protein